MKIVLVGYMGSGKSIVGRQLSQVLDANFLDLDTEIEKEEGMSISSLFEKRGEIYFRKKEFSTLLQCLDSNEKSIIATGGGTPCYGNVMETLSERPDVITVYLKASLDTLTERLAEEKAKRPMIAHLETKELLNDFIRKHLFERNFFYFKAQKTIIVDDKTVSEIVDEIVATLF
ncbi:Shikimate kinase [unidentified eubacterium SCB49]|nr:Shikimate kinase [unidentified eubacterium SCB49]